VVSEFVSRVIHFGGGAAVNACRKSTRTPYGPISERQPSAIKAVSRLDPIRNGVESFGTALLILRSITRESLHHHHARKQSLSKNPINTRILAVNALPEGHMMQTWCRLPSTSQHMNQPAIGEMLRDREDPQIGDTQPG